MEDVFVDSVVSKLRHLWRNLGKYSPGIQVWKMTFLLNRGGTQMTRLFWLEFRPCFLNPLIPKTFGGLTFQNRGHLGSRMYVCMYVCIYTYIHIYIGSSRSFSGFIESWRHAHDSGSLLHCRITFISIIPPAFQSIINIIFSISLHIDLWLEFKIKKSYRIYIYSYLIHTSCFFWGGMIVTFGTEWSRAPAVPTESQFQGSQQSTLTLNAWSPNDPVRDVFCSRSHFMLLVHGLYAFVVYGEFSV